MYGTKKCLKFGTIVKRSTFINANLTDVQQKNVERKFGSLITQLENAKLGDGSLKPSIKSSIGYVLESLNSFNNANLYKDEPFQLLEKVCKLDDKNTSSYIVHEYSNTILPYIKDLGAVERLLAEHNEIDKEYKTKINESINELKVADRILENHATLSKRFNIDSEVQKYRAIGLKKVTENVCTMIDTYSITPYQKLNLCIEELSYLFGKNNYAYDKPSMVDYVTEYFLLSESILSSKDLAGYRKALSENACLSESDIKSVRYLFEEDLSNIPQISINYQTYRFLTSQEKTPELFLDCILTAIECDQIDMTYNFDKLLYFIGNVYRSGVISEDQIINALNKWSDKFVSLIKSYIESEDSFPREVMECIIESLDSYITFSTDDTLKEIMTKLRAELYPLYSILYTKYNIECISFVNNKNNAPILIEEAKIFKHHNLLRAVINLDKYLADKCKVARNAVENKAKELKNKADKILYPEKEKKQSKIIPVVKDVASKLTSAVAGLVAAKESFNAYEYIGEDNKFDMVLYRLELDESYNIDSVHEELTDICREFNDKLSLQNIDTSRCYYIINPGVAEIHIKDSIPFSLSEAEMDIINKSYDHEMDYYIEQLATSENYCDFLNSCSTDNIEDRLNSYFVEYMGVFSLEKFETITEALSILGVSKESVNLFADKYLNYEYSILSEDTEYESLSDKVNNICESYEEIYDINYTAQLEAYLALDTLLDTDKLNIYSEANDNQEKSKEDLAKEKDEIKANPFKGINLNTMKIYLQALKSKFKIMSQKEKEISRNIDMNFKRLVESFKNALISDRREAVIKGSVIPSFSKCMKIAVALAGVARFANPGLAAIIAIGGFAMSKHLTKKERILLLDEIDTELEVVEKEIQMAESKNQMKRYRQLLNYKKDLQRQYQRIRYNVQVGKDILPGSTMGVKQYNQ